MAPWAVSDVEKHKKGLTDVQKKKWVSIANSVLKKCQEDEGTDCEGKAMRIANSRVTQAAIEDDDIFTIASRLDEETLQAVLDAKKRSNLDDGDFAIPRLRKLPLISASHVRNALARFNQVKGATAEELRKAKKKIMAAAKKFGIEIKEFTQAAMPSGEKDFDTILQVEIYQAETVDMESRKIPILIGRSGMSKMPVGMVADDGGVESTYIMWPKDMIKMLKERMTQGEGLKSYYGHVLPNQFSPHRDNSDWIATLDKSSLRLVDMVVNEEDETGLVGDLQVHADNEKSNMLMNRIKEAPDEVKFSLDYQGTFEPMVSAGGMPCMNVCDIWRVKSVDWVPEAGYDNGIWSDQAVMQSIKEINNYLKEVIGMNIEKYRELHPEEYKVAEAQIIQSAVAKITSDFETARTAWEKEKTAMQAIIEETKKKIPADGEVPAFKDSSEYKILVQQNETLAKQNSQLIKKNSATDLTMSRVMAEGLVIEALQQSLIPEALWPRVRTSSIISYNQFLVDDAETLTMKLDQERFNQALQAEILSWEKSMPREGFPVGGLPLKGADGQVVSVQQAEADEWLKEQKKPDRKTYGKKKEQ